MSSDGATFGLRLFLIVFLALTGAVAIEAVDLIAGRPVGRSGLLLLGAWAVLTVVLIALWAFGPRRLRASVVRGGWLLAAVLFITATSLLVVNTAARTTSSPVLGLDLQGGFSVVLQAKEVDGRLPPEDSVEKAKDIIRQRVDGLGVAEPDITRQGRTVIVQLPGVKNRAKAESVVGCTAKLEFRPVISAAPNPDAPGAPATSTTKADGTTTTTSGGDPSTTAAGGGATSTTAGDGSTSSTTGAGVTTPTTGGETGQGAAGLAPGEGALPGQFAPTTTTTAPPPTTAPPTTAPPATTAPPGGSSTTAPGGTTTTAAGGSTTTTAPATGGTGERSAACGSGSSEDERKTTTTTTTPEQKGTEQFPSDDGKLLYTLGPVGFGGDALTSAQAALDSSGAGGWQVNVKVKGSQQGAANTAFNACFDQAPTCPSAGPNDQGGPGPGAIAIVLDAKVLSAPAVNSRDLASDQFQITGDFDEGEAKDLEVVLKYGALPVEFDQAALQQVSATLGEDSLRAGLIAGFIGLAAVALYMILYYRGLGLVVIAGLGVWAGLMYGLICWLGEVQGLALSLSGITGIIVSVGTTVDSYVVFFERLKDEVRAGRSVRSSTERGFNSAFRTILTADVASFIGAGLLWYLTVGPVRGFAFFLGISVVLDLIVAYLFTRPLVILLGRSKRLTDARILGLASALDRATEPGAAARAKPAGAAT